MKYYRKEVLAGPPRLDRSHPSVRCARLGRQVSAGLPDLRSAPSSLLVVMRSGKLDRARSGLYRSHILQENMRWKALAEI